MKAVVLGLAAMACMSSASAVTVFSENFELWGVDASLGYTTYNAGVGSAPTSVAPAYTAGNGWTLAGTIDTVIGAYGAINGTSVDLAGTPVLGQSGHGTLYNTITGLVVGQAYNYSFNYSANGGSIGFSYNTSPGAFSSSNYQELTGLGALVQSKSVDFVAASDTFVIAFTSVTNANYLNNVNAGGTIDDVLLVTTAVPEPGETAMMLAGLGVVGLIARRRRNS
jgi:hypothetical protein